MKGVYLGENQDPHNNHPKPPTNMFAKLQHQHHHQQPPQFSNHHPPPSFHHPFHPPNATTPNSHSEESHSPTTPSTTPPPITTATTTTSPTTIKKESTPHDGASIEILRRPRGRPPGSKNKPKPPIIITQESEPPMRPYVLELSPNIDIVETVTRFCNTRAIGLCILSGSGAVANVTLRQPSTTSTSATVTFHGRFDILSISATIFPNATRNSNDGDAMTSSNGPSNFTISLAGPQGQVFGGAVVGPLASAGVIFLISATFTNPCYQKLPLQEDSRNGGIAASASGGGGNSEGAHNSSPPPPPAEGVGMYGCHLSSEIWGATARQPPLPPQQPPY